MQRHQHVDHLYGIPLTKILRLRLESFLLRFEHSYKLMFPSHGVHHAGDLHVHKVHYHRIVPDHVHLWESVPEPSLVKHQCYYYDSNRQSNESHPLNQSDVLVQNTRLFDNPMKHQEGVR